MARGKKKKAPPKKSSVKAPAPAAANQQKAKEEEEEEKENGGVSSNKKSSTTKNDRKVAATSSSPLPQAESAMDQNATTNAAAEMPKISPPVNLWQQQQPSAYSTANNTPSSSSVVHNNNTASSHIPPSVTNLRVGDTDVPLDQFPNDVGDRNRGVGRKMGAKILEQERQSFVVDQTHHHQHPQVSPFVIPLSSTLNTRLYNNSANLTHNNNNTVNAFPSLSSRPQPNSTISNSAFNNGNLVQGSMIGGENSNSFIIVDDELPNDDDVVILDTRTGARINPPSNEKESGSNPYSPTNASTNYSLTRIPTTTITKRSSQTPPGTPSRQRTAAPSHPPVFPAEVPPSLNIFHRAQQKSRQKRKEMVNKLQVTVIEDDDPHEDEEVVSYTKKATHHHLPAPLREEGLLQMQPPPLAQKKKLAKQNDEDDDEEVVPLSPQDRLLQVCLGQQPTDRQIPTNTKHAGKLLPSASQLSDPQQKNSQGSSIVNRSRKRDRNARSLSPVPFGVAPVQLDPSVIQLDEFAEKRAVERELEDLFPAKFLKQGLLSAATNTVTDQHVLDPGEFWSAFKSIEYVGEGAFGFVWRCVTFAGDTVAIKSSPMSLDSVEAIEDAYSVVREVAVLRFLNSRQVPHVLPLHAAFMVKAPEALPPHLVEKFRQKEAEKKAAKPKTRAQLAAAKEAEKRKKKEQEEEEERQKKKEAKKKDKNKKKKHGAESSSSDGEEPSFLFYTPHRPRKSQGIRELSLEGFEDKQKKKKPAGKKKQQTLEEQYSSSSEDQKGSKTGNKSKTKKMLMVRGRGRGRGRGSVRLQYLEESSKSSSSDETTSDEDNDSTSSDSSEGPAPRGRGRGRGRGGKALISRDKRKKNAKKSKVETKKEQQKAKAAKKNGKGKKVGGNRKQKAEDSDSTEESESEVDKKKRKMAGGKIKKHQKGNKMKKKGKEESSDTSEADDKNRNKNKKMKLEKDEKEEAKRGKGKNAKRSATSSSTSSSSAGDFSFPATPTRKSQQISAFNSKRASPTKATATSTSTLPSPGTIARSPMKDLQTSATGTHYSERMPSFFAIGEDDALESDITLFMVTDLCDGDLETFYKSFPRRNLGDFASSMTGSPTLRPSPTPSNVISVPANCEDIAEQVALRMSEALAHMHKLGLLHLDLKPSNILFRVRRKQSSVKSYTTRHKTETAKLASRSSTFLSQLEVPKANERRNFATFSANSTAAANPAGSAVQTAAAALGSGMMGGGSLDPTATMTNTDVTGGTVPPSPMINQSPSSIPRRRQSSSVVSLSLSPQQQELLPTINVIPATEIEFFLTDFGNCRIIGPALEDCCCNVVGTYEYMDTWALECECCDRATDSYSLGCSLYQLLTGRLSVAPCKKKHKTHTPQCFIEETKKEIQTDSGLLQHVRRSLAHLAKSLMCQDRRYRLTMPGCYSAVQLMLSRRPSLSGRRDSTTLSEVMPRGSVVGSDTFLPASTVEEAQSTSVKATPSFTIHNAIRLSNENGCVEKDSVAMNAFASKSHIRTGRLEPQDQRSEGEGSHGVGAAGK